ncbi:GNAT family N-acetyltransferase [Streptosporangium sandarakinum]|uniref:GNAT family N-acetyltransferase n=1 Tax=Streptosporangium sandarakinum TaxID=1260955 RepID=UPI003713F48C
MSDAGHHSRRSREDGYGPAMASRRKTPGRADRIPAISPDRLAHGWSGPNGTKIRMLADGQADRWLELVEMSGAAHEDALLTAVREGMPGWLLPVGLADGPHAMRRRFLEVISARTEQAALCAMAGLSAPLVVQDRGGRVVAALHAVSLPPAVVANAADRGIPFEIMIAALTAVMKIRAVAVDEPLRGQGIGSALLTRCLQLYFQLGFDAAYGQFRTGSGLETFYARQGFTVLDEGAVFSLRDRLGLPFRIQADPGERIFTRVRGG